MFGPLLDVQSSFVWQAQGILHLEGFVAVSKTMAGVGHMKKICKDACRVAGAVVETSASKMSGGQGADFLRGVTQHFVYMTWPYFLVAGAIL